MKNVFIAIFWLLGLACAFLAGKNQRPHPPEPVILTKTDTVRIQCPEVTAIYVRGERIEQLPLATDSARKDSVQVIIPVSQAVYAEDDYRAYVSGYRPQLDSLIFTERYYETTRAVPQKGSRWSIGLQAGYGITPRGFPPVIGIGVSFRIY